MEHIRFRQSSNNWQTAMEKKINDVSSKIDQLLSLRDEIASINAKLSDHLMGKPAPAMQGSSSTGVAWEACSPFTSMMSLEDNSAQDAIGATTPVAPQASLESTQALLSRITAIQDGYGEDQTDDKSTSSLLSQKPTAVTTKSGLIHTACQSMTFISSLHALFGEKNIAFTTSAIAIYDRVTGTRSKICNDPCPTSDCTSDEGLWNGIRSMYKYHLLESQETMLEAKTEWNKYVSPLELKFYMIGPNMKELDFNSNRIILSLQTASGVAELAGGILAGNVNEQHPVLSSSRTVLFLLLSCYLAEASGEAQHRRIAKLSANCVATQMIDSQTSLRLAF
ncbi:hypothetical protein FRC03_011775 [Tulasnella sp. 419]|nr:hypothetical protein FRC03_011775 [Tulasnella sp. 419]